MTAVETEEEVATPVPQPRDPIRDMLFPPHIRPTNPNRRNVKVYNVYDRMKPLRYEVFNETSYRDGADNPDPGWIVFDLIWRSRVDYQKNERPIFLEMNALNAMYRREIHMYDETRVTGLLGDCLQAQDRLVALRQSRDFLDQGGILGRGALVTDKNDEFAHGILMLTRRFLDPAIIRAEYTLQEAREALLAHSKIKPKWWETPYGVLSTKKARWRIEKDMLAVVTPLPADAAPGAVCAYVTRRTPFKPYRGQGVGVALAAQRAAEILPPMLDADRARFEHLLAHGDEALNPVFTYPDRSRIERDLRRAVQTRIYRMSRINAIDMSPGMIAEAIDYVLDPSMRKGRQ